MVLGRRGEKERGMREMIKFKDLIYIYVWKKFRERVVGIYLVMI